MAKEKLVPFRCKVLRVDGTTEEVTRGWDLGSEDQEVIRGMPPHPETDYSLPVCCPVCGQHRPKGRKETSCVPCLNQGHIYRLVGRLELLWMSERYKRLGYDEVAARQKRFALTLPPEPREVHVRQEAKQPKVPRRVPQTASAPGDVPPRRRTRRA